MTAELRAESRGSPTLDGRLSPADCPVKRNPANPAIPQSRVVAGVELAHEDFPGPGTRVELGPEAHLPGDEYGTQFAPAAVIVGGDPPTRDPAVETVRVLPEEVLDLPNAQMLGGLLDRRHPLLFDRGRRRVVLGLGERSGRRRPQAGYLGLEASTIGHAGSETGRRLEVSVGKTIPMPGFPVS